VGLRQHGIGTIEFLKITKLFKKMVNTKQQISVLKGLRCMKKKVDITIGILYIREKLVTLKYMIKEEIIWERLIPRRAF